MRKHLESVQCVIVDEVHELASSKRGVQLTIALERLREVTGEDFQRIGLSATVGNPEEVAKFIAGTSRKIEVVHAVLAKQFRYSVESPSPRESDFELAAKLETSPEVAARIRRLTELVDSHKSTLIFVNSRTLAEMIGHKFIQLDRTDVAVHHGSIAKEERISIEDQFKAGQLKAIIATSTLELGIDIGSVDLVVQYMSPRQVGTLIQRVGRSGHKLSMLSEGVIITVYPDDTLESVAAVKNAQAGKIEPVIIHEKALDVMAHQIAGWLMDKETITTDELRTLLRKAYPYRKLTKRELLDVTYFLESLNQLKIEGNLVRKGRKTREYYYGNLSMIPDERRYPVINILSDRRIGTLGDEFMALHARIGLNFIMRGKVWRIVQIEEETGTVHVVPSEDPSAAIPGWDGEILPVPFELAQRTGKTREEIAKMLRAKKDVETIAGELGSEYGTDKTSFLEAVKEIDEQLKSGAPLPTEDNVILEHFDKYIIVHACFGEMANRTLAGVFDSMLSEREIISGWWTDGYRVLIETARKITPQEAEKMPTTLFNLTEEEVDEAFKKYVDAKFPFAYKMKSVAERFGVLPRGKTMSYERQAKLKAQFQNTPVYDETIREAMLEKADIKRVKQIIHSVKVGEIKVSTIYRSEKPTPMAYHILAKYADVSEMMAPERVILTNIDRMKMAIEARTATLLCMNCGQWTTQAKIRELPDEPQCANCQSSLIAPLYFGQDINRLKETLQKRGEKQELTEEDLKELSQARRKADLILSYGKPAIVALQVKGVGPETASRILGKMHTKEDDFYLDLLKAKIQYLRTREFWDNKESKR
jgi:ATP-dependent Lhr-like helicase